MMRSVWVVLTVLATAGASAAPPLPVPPIPPADPPLDQYAPMPDRDAQAPVDNTDQRIKFNVQDFRIRRFYQGQAYSRGSRFETSEEKKPIQTPGLTVQVPLQ